MVATSFIGAYQCRRMNSPYDAPRVMYVRCRSYEACGTLRALSNRRRARVPLFWAPDKGANAMSLGLILLIVVILMLVGVVPAWPHARGWGYGPSGIVGVVLL